MSNLKLPIMRYESFIDSRFGVKRKIAYKTTAERYNYSHGGYRIVIRHHGNAIAELYSDGTVWLGTGGWNSKTTAHRLEAIARDTKINNGATGYSIGIRDGVIVVLDRTTNMRRGMYLGRGGENFIKRDGRYVLATATEEN
jgi:hypothetical protein